MGLIVWACATVSTHDVHRCSQFSGRALVVHPNLDVTHAVPVQQGAELLPPAFTVAAVLIVNAVRDFMQDGVRDSTWLFGAQLWGAELDEVLIQRWVDSAGDLLVPGQGGVALHPPPEGEGRAKWWVPCFGRATDDLDGRLFDDFLALRPRRGEPGFWVCVEKPAEIRGDQYRRRGSSRLPAVACETAT